MPLSGFQSRVAKLLAGNRCLYYSIRESRFIQPELADSVVPHFGRPGGILPRVL